MNSEQKKIKEQQAEWQEVCITALPEFLSQLLLLLNSGMTLLTAFQRIAERYDSFPGEQKNDFMKEICRIYKESRQTGENAVALFCQFSRSSGSRELARAAGIMAASLDTGADLWTELELQGKQLWESRKRLILEKIRIGESKMSFPLGLLMIALLLVTAAPAMLQI